MDPPCAVRRKRLQKELLLWPHSERMLTYMSLPSQVGDPLDH